MEFSKVKKQVIGCLESGNVIHPHRNDISIKNLLSAGEISTKDVIGIIKKARGNECEASPHHSDKDIEVYILKTTYVNKSWYIKWYFMEPDAMFLSVHERNI